MRCRAILFRYFAHTGPHAKRFHAPYYGRPDQTGREFDLTKPKQNRNQGGKDGAYDLVLCMQCHVSQIGLTLAASGGDFASKSRLSECHDNRTFEPFNYSSSHPARLAALQGPVEPVEKKVKPEREIWPCGLLGTKVISGIPVSVPRPTVLLLPIPNWELEEINAGTDVCRGVGVARELGTGATENPNLASASRQGPSGTKNGPGLDDSCSLSFAFSSGNNANGRRAPFYPIKRHQTGEKQKRTRTGANTKRFDAIPSCAKRSGRLERALYPEICKQLIKRAQPAGDGGDGGGGSLPTCGPILSWLCPLKSSFGPFAFSFSPCWTEARTILPSTKRLLHAPKERIDKEEKMVQPHRAGRRHSTGSIDRESASSDWRQDWTGNPSRHLRGFWLLACSIARLWLMWSTHGTSNRNVGHEPGPCSSLAEECPEKASSVEDDAVRLKKRVVVIFRPDINDTTTKRTEEFDFGSRARTRRNSLSHISIRLAFPHFKICMVVGLPFRCSLGKLRSEGLQTGQHLLSSLRLLDQPVSRCITSLCLHSIGTGEQQQHHAITHISSNPAWSVIRKPNIQRPPTMLPLTFDVHFCTGPPMETENLHCKSGLVCGCAGAVQSVRYYDRMPHCIADLLTPHTYTTTHASETHSGQVVVGSPSRPAVFSFVCRSTWSMSWAFMSLVACQPHPSPPHLSNLRNWPLIHGGDEAFPSRQQTRERSLLVVKPRCRRDDDARLANLNPSGHRIIFLGFDPRLHKVEAPEFTPSLMSPCRRLENETNPVLKGIPLSSRPPQKPQYPKTSKIQGPPDTWNQNSVLVLDFPANHISHVMSAQRHHPQCDPLEEQTPQVRLPPLGSSPSRREPRREGEFDPVYSSPSCRGLSLNFIRRPDISTITNPLSTPGSPRQCGSLDGTMAPNTARLTIFVFGLSSFAAGVHSLLRPHDSLKALDLPAAALPAANGNALAAIAMGIYYTLAAAQDNRAFFLATIPMRLTSAFVFWRQDWGIVSGWEGGSAALTLLALAWDARQRTKTHEA
ncbi:uncharacterized protein CLUP02_13287 [Colletotrichum lupini]|uniref:Uncharacterized protein n=5 Tax=Colletotrichum acutatum species complex TaxID=2707335 RepID=A0A9Q8T2M0_9PEZI|nr:uncharacterized protein CLUP02_13287 [Colletotrichum lupini]UQC87768.1 hypothetical protein CLUP02_13287 [Colletotrichum lupini]